MHVQYLLEISYVLAKISLEVYANTDEKRFVQLIANQKVISENFISSKSAYKVCRIQKRK